MRLDRIVGWHPNFTSSQIYLNQYPKLQKEILYTQANQLLGFYSPLQKQILFYERHTNNIDQLLFLKNFSFTVCKSLEQKSKDNEVTIWSLDNIDITYFQSQNLLLFKQPLKSIHSISFSNDEDHLCLAGIDNQVRNVIIIYKFQDMIKLKKIEIVVRKLSDFET